MVSMKQDVPVFYYYCYCSYYYYYCYYYYYYYYHFSTCKTRKRTSLNHAARLQPETQEDARGIVGV